MVPILFVANKFHFEINKLITSHYFRNSILYEIKTKYITWFLASMNSRCYFYELSSLNIKKYQNKITKKKTQKKEKAHEITQK